MDRDKVTFSGRIVSVQPRIRLIRSFDQRYHDYRGYVLALEGICDGETGEFSVAVGESAVQKHQLGTGVELAGLAFPVADPRLETAGFYRVSGLKILERPGETLSPHPPFLGVPPDLETYRGRGHRRLDTRTYQAKCSECIWACRMPVEIIVDHWEPWKKRYRTETFCYGPKNCRFYRAGPARKVPGRRGMSFTEEDWVDEDATAHRSPEE